MATDYWSMSLSELTDLRRRRAASANRAIRKLNQAGLLDKPGAYERYTRPYLRQFGITRYSEAKTSIKGANEYQRRKHEIAMLSNIDLFMGAKSHTVAGYREAKTRQARGFANALKLDFTDAELEKLFASASFGWLLRTLGSEIAQDINRAVNQGTATLDEILNNVDLLMTRYDDGERLRDMTRQDIIAELQAAPVPQKLKRKKSKGGQSGNATGGHGTGGEIPPLFRG